MGFAQFTSTTATMLGVLVLLAQCPATRAVSLSQPLMLLGYAYMLGLSVAVAALATLAPARGARLLYALVAANGVATGLTQGLAAFIAGQFSALSAVDGASGSLLAGAGAGIALPTIVQLVSLPVAAHSATDAASAHRIAGGALVTSCAFSAAVLCAGVACTLAVFRHPTLRVKSSPGQRRLPEGGGG